MSFTHDCLIVLSLNFNILKGHPCRTMNNLLTMEYLRNPICFSDSISDENFSYYLWSHNYRTKLCYLRPDISYLWSYHKLFHVLADFDPFLPTNFLLSRPTWHGSVVTSTLKT